MKKQTRGEITGIDLSIFKNIKTKSKKCKSYQSCSAIGRLIASLSYYQLLNVKSVTNHQEIFINFVNNVYKHQKILNDFHHLQQEHGQQIHEIMEYITNNQSNLKQCNINECNYASRHYRVYKHENNFIRSIFKCIL